MVTLNTMPKDTVAEVLRFLSENEDFHSVENIPTSDLTVPEVRAMLRELAGELEREANAEAKQTYDVKRCKTLSKSAKQIISTLSPREEKSLLAKFGLIEKK